MEEIHITAAQTAAMGIAAIIGYTFPLVLWIIWRKKTGASWLPLVAGFLGFIVIGTVRGVFRTIFLADMKSTPMLYYIIQAFIAGVSEEGGKYLVMRYAIPNRDHYRDSVSYGIGHSLVEHYAANEQGVMLYGCLTALFFLTGGMEAFAPGGAGAFLMEGLDEAGTLEILRNVSENTVFFCIRKVLESVPVGHICFSVLVFTAVHYDNSPKWLFAAIGLHALIDIVVGLYIAHHITHLEFNVLSLLFDAGLIYLTYRVWQQYHMPKSSQL
jgi:uncharacterized membrane protein YhfC